VTEITWTVEIKAPPLEEGETITDEFQIMCDDAQREMCEFWHVVMLTQIGEELTKEQQALLDKYTRED